MKRKMKVEELKPTFWRTCRALRNRRRLDLLKIVFEFPGEFGVTAFGEKVGMKESLASQYLRQLNARGILSVRRERRYVYYSTSPDRSLSRAVVLQEAFRDFFRQNPLHGWQDELMRKLNAFTHFNRISILRYLTEHETGNVLSLRSAIDRMVGTIWHHLRILQVSGLVGIQTKSGNETEYCLIPPDSRLVQIILELSLQ